MVANSSDCILLVQKPGHSPQLDYPTFEPIDVGVGAALIVIAVSFVGLRFAATLRKERRLFAEDYFCLVALALATVCVGLEIASRHGYGHAYDMTSCLTEQPRRQALEIVAFLAYYPTMLFVKVAVCTVYLRLFSTIRWIKHCTWSTMVLYSLFCIVGFFIALARYVDNDWNNDTDYGFDVKPFVVFQTALNIVVDLILLLIPISPIMQLNMPRDKRLGLVAVFCAMAGATVCSAVLLAFRVQYYYTTFNDPQYDFTWAYATMKLLVLVELYANIILACVPGVVVAWRTFVHPIIGSTFASRFRSSHARHSTASDADTDAIVVSKEVAVETDPSRLSVIREESPQYGHKAHVAGQV